MEELLFSCSRLEVGQNIVDCCIHAEKYVAGDESQKIEKEMSHLLLVLLVHLKKAKVKIRTAKEMCR
jgi:hypothetical protein